MGCMENLSRTQHFILFLQFAVYYNQLLKRRNVWAKTGGKRPNYGQNHILKWHRLVQFDTVILAECNLDRTVRVNYVSTHHGPKSNFTA